MFHALGKWLQCEVIRLSGSPDESKGQAESTPWSARFQPHAFLVVGYMDKSSVGIIAAFVWGRFAGHSRFVGPL